MNYVVQLNRFYDSLQTNSLTPNSICLYSILLHINNKCNWKDEFTVANKSIEALSGLSRVQLDRSRNELKQKGYIDYKKGSGNVAGIYLIVRFDTQTDTQVYTHGDTQVYTQTDTEMIHKCSTLNKLNKKLEYIYTPPVHTREYFESVKNLCKEHCPIIFERHLKKPNADYNLGIITAEVEPLYSLPDLADIFKHANKTYFVKPKMRNMDLCWLMNNLEKVKNEPEESTGGSDVNSDGGRKSNGLSDEMRERIRKKVRGE